MSFTPLRVLITGADGFLGSNVVRELLSRGHKVKAFIHPTSKSNTLEGLEIEIFNGDLLNADSIAKAANGVDAIIHTAANTQTWPTRCPEHEAVNTLGTANIIAAAIKHKVNRMVYVGTANTFGSGTKENPGTEKNPYTSFKYKLGYMDSKYEAHNMVIDAVKKGLPAIIVNPTFMFGPFDFGPSSGALILAVYKGKVPGYSPGGKNYVYVKDVSTAICNALTMGTIGESHILGNENLTYKEAFDIIAKQTGSKAPKIKMPGFAVKTYGLISSFFSALTGKAPGISYRMAQISCEGVYYSSAKAIRELKLPQTPISVAIDEAFEWFKNNNKL